MRGGRGDEDGGHAGLLCVGCLYEHLARLLTGL